MVVQNVPPVQGERGLFLTIDAVDVGWLDRAMSPSPIHDARKRNANRALAVVFAGKKVAFARALKMSPSNLGKYLNGQKTIGNKVAKDMEDAAHWPRGSLDAPPGSLPQAFDAALLERAIMEVEAAITHSKRSVAAHKKARLIKIVYSALVAEEVVGDVTRWLELVE